MVSLVALDLETGAYRSFVLGMTNVYIKRSDQEPFEVAKNQVVAGIKKGELLADDEISADGKKWIRLDQHKQIAPLFAKGGAKAPPKRKKMTEEEFYANKEVVCPKCGFEQQRDAACMKCNVLFEKYWDIKKGRVKTKTQTIRTTVSKRDSGGSGESVGFVKALWRGDYPLWVTFWIFNGVVPWVFTYLIEVGTEKIFLADMPKGFTPPVNQEQMTQEEMIQMTTQMMIAMLDQILPIVIGTLALGLVYYFIVNVGLWRSASNHTGAAIWRVLVKILVVFFFIGFPFWVGGLGWITYIYLTGNAADLLTSFG